MTFDFNQFTLANGQKRSKNPRNERLEIAHAIPNAAEKYDGDADRCEVLLMSKRFVRRDENFKSRVDGRAEQNSVSQAQPSLRSDGSDFVTHQLARKRDGQ
jgi:hypothetical protein